MLSRRDRFRQRRPRDISALNRIVQRGTVRYRLVSGRQNSAVAISSVVARIRRGLDSLGRVRVHGNLRVLKRNPRKRTLRRFVATVMDAPRNRVTSNLTAVTRRLNCS